MSNLACEYLQSLGKTDLSSAELDNFVAELERQDGGSREEALAYLLRIVQLTPEQVIELSQAQPVRSTVGLQLLLKRYTRARQYAASNTAEAKRLASGWAKAAEFVKALIMSLPPS
jgi:hypothetical protein